jgi:CTP-dependent riboflavin kinase
LYKKKEFKGSISELSRQLGYADDSPVNKMVNELITDGFIEEKDTKSGKALVLTAKGERKVRYLTIPKYSLIFLLVLSLGNIYWGIGGLLFNQFVGPEYVLILGILSFLCVIIIWWMQKEAEKEF